MSEVALVSRVSPVQAALRNCAGDEGRLLRGRQPLPGSGAIHLRRVRGALRAPFGGAVDKDAVSRIGLGRLPGDIVIERENVTLYFALMTCLLLSLLLSPIFWFVNR